MWLPIYHYIQHVRLVISIARIVCLFEQSDTIQEIPNRKCLYRYRLYSEPKLRILHSVDFMNRPLTPLIE
jgi:hypothetical protein